MNLTYGRPSIVRSRDLSIISAGDLPFVLSHFSKLQNANAVLNCRLLDPYRDRVSSPNLAYPFITLECRKRLCNGFIERFCRHFQRMLVTVRVFARYRAGRPHSHVAYFRLLFASTQVGDFAPTSILRAVTPACFRQSMARRPT